VTTWGWPQPGVPGPQNEHWELALRGVDARVALALNTGSLDFPRAVAEFTADELSHQLDAAAMRFFSTPGVITVDRQRRVISLPWVCEFFLRDARRPFVANAPNRDAANREVLKACLHFVNKATWRELSELLLLENPPIQVRFRPPSTKYHDALELEPVKDERARLKARANLLSAPGEETDDEHDDGDRPSSRSGDHDDRPNANDRWDDDLDNDDDSDEQLHSSVVGLENHTVSQDHYQRIPDEAPLPATFDDIEPYSYAVIL